MSDSNNTAEKKEKPADPETRNAVGIRFRPCGKIYTFEIGNIDIAPGTKVVVESDMGVSIGSVSKPKHTVKTKDPLKKVLRLATEKDLEKAENNRSIEDEAKSFCIEKARDYDLQMKVVTSEITLDKKKLIFYFTADGRIDFRELVRDLASKFKTRIEMRQIGVRDEVKILGGLGACGRQACCNLFLTSFIPVTIKMAKQQDLSINQSKLSGVCGRLMCCLGYEGKEPGGNGRSNKVKEDKEFDGKVDDFENGLQIETDEQEQVSEQMVPGAEQEKPPVKTEQAPEKESKVSPEEDRKKDKQKRSRGRKRRGRSRKSRQTDSSSKEGAKQERKEQDNKARDNQNEGSVQAPKKGHKAFNRRRKFIKKKKQQQDKNE